MSIGSHNYLICRKHDLHASEKPLMAMSIPAYFGKNHYSWSEIRSQDQGKNWDFINVSEINGARLESPAQSNVSLEQALLLIHKAQQSAMGDPCYDGANDFHISTPHIHYHYLAALHGVYIKHNQEVLPIKQQLGILQQGAAARILTEPEMVESICFYAGLSTTELVETLTSAHDTYQETLANAFGLLCFFGQEEDALKLHQKHPHIYEAKQFSKTHAVRALLNSPKALKAFIQQIGSLETILNEEIEMRGPIVKSYLDYKDLPKASYCLMSELASSPNTQRLLNLIKAGGDIHGYNFTRDCPLVAAIDHSQDENALLLAQAGALEKPLKQGGTPLKFRPYWQELFDDQRHQLLDRLCQIKPELYAECSDRNIPFGIELILLQKAEKPELILSQQKIQTFLSGTSDNYQKKIHKLSQEKSLPKNRKAHPKLRFS